MKIRIFPSRSDIDSFVDYEVELLSVVHLDLKYSDSALPSLFLDDVISDLIDKN